MATMPKVFFLVAALTANCESFPKPKQVPVRNQRIIKIQGPPHFNHFHGHHKVVRGRPYGKYHKEEFIRPNHPPPIPPFFNGPANHIKHLPRPPPHVFHKSPSYGLGFPYKSINSLRATIHKDHVRVPPLTGVRSVALSPTAAGTLSGTSTSTSSVAYHHSSPFTASTYIASPVGPIISSDDNNGPIHEIPAPNLAPKPHGASIGGFGNVGTNGYSSFGNDVGLLSSGLPIKPFDGSFGGVNAITQDVASNALLSGVKHVGDINSNVLLGGVKYFGADANSNALLGGVKHIGADTSSNIIFSGIKHYGADVTSNALLNGGKHIGTDVASTVFNTLVKDPNVDVNAIIKDDVTAYIKESDSDLPYGKETTVEIANFDQGSSIDVTNLIKDATASNNQNSGYEVTEHHSSHDQSSNDHDDHDSSEEHISSNDLVIKGVDGTKLYYAPDPDPSLPVHKVPPTSDPHSTPSNGQNIKNVYVSQISHGFPYVQGGSIGTLTGQELFQLMNGYSAVLPQPVVSFVGQPQAHGLVLSNAGLNYYQPNIGSSIGHYAQTAQYGNNDVGQYLQQPDIHNLIHASDNQEQQSLGASQNPVVSNDNYQQQSVYSPQNQYQSYIQSQHQTSYKDSESESSDDNYGTSEINHNYQYEPEASESRNRLTVFKPAGDTVINSETVKELLLEDSAANELQYQTDFEKETASESVPTIIQLKNIPEVPFYASLPNKKAAEALASLQAAGSVASNYMNRIKIRGDQGPEQEQSDRQGKGENFEDAVSSQVDIPQTAEHEAKEQPSIFGGQAIKLGSEKTVVEIQQSIPLFESKITGQSLIGDQDQISEGSSVFTSEEQPPEEEEEEEPISDVKEDGSSQVFGRRIRPK